MLLPEINWSACSTCKICEAKLACKTRAINRLDPDDPPYIDYDLCSSCGNCITACQFGAIRAEGVKPRIFRPGI